MQLALLPGQVDLTSDNLATASANIHSGKLRVIAGIARTRAAAVPELPTIAEAGQAFGLGGFSIDTWFALFGPAKLPADVTLRLNKAFVDAIESPEVRARMATLMVESAASTAEQFGAFVKAALAKYEQVVKASGATVE